MKPRAGWLARFTAWFFNTSTEWVPPEKRQDEHADQPRQAQPKQTQQEQQSESVADDVRADDVAPPSQPPH